MSMVPSDWADMFAKAFPNASPNESLLPISMRVAAKTIGMDLVSVVPMSAPTGHIMYSDFAYGGPADRITLNSIIPGIGSLEIRIDPNFDYYVQLTLLDGDPIRIVRGRGTNVEDTYIAIRVAVQKVLNNIDCETLRSI